MKTAFITTIILLMLTISNYATEYIITVKNVDFTLVFDVDPPNSDYMYEHYDGNDVNNYYDDKSDFVNKAFIGFKKEMCKYPESVLKNKIVKTFYITFNMHEKIHVKQLGNKIETYGKQFNIETNLHGNCFRDGGLTRKLYKESDDKLYYRIGLAGFSLGTKYIALNGLNKRGSTTLHHEIFHSLHNDEVLYIDKYGNTTIPYNKDVILLGKTLTASEYNNDHLPNEFLIGFPSQYGMSCHNEEIAEIYGHLMHEQATGNIMTWTRLYPESELAIKTKKVIDFISNTISSDMDYDYFVEIERNFPN